MGSNNSTSGTAVAATTANRADHHRAADTLKVMALIYVAIVSTAALAFSLMALIDARVARAPADARLLQAPNAPGERPLERPKEWWA
ncbi:hypothetical protein [Paracoccus sanguinis]|uniref:Uncharacterized protein n=1 Tax=Paracoccus sanguinis TaxID=1545044 RepID=A0A099GNS9_9RHOB|nr:hypothetical protein [Paracoccus sanguinis]KGJ23733.1 hypothetical protein IX56_00170 [Paracoccus sanguinis]